MSQISGLWGCPGKNPAAPTTLYQGFGGSPLNLFLFYPAVFPDFGLAEGRKALSPATLGQKPIKIGDGINLRVP